MWHLTSMWDQIIASIVMEQTKGFYCNRDVSCTTCTRYPRVGVTLVSRARLHAWMHCMMVMQKGTDWFWSLQQASCWYKCIQSICLEFWLYSMHHACAPISCHFFAYKIWIYIIIGWAEASPTLITHMRNCRTYVCMYVCECVCSDMSSTCSSHSMRVRVPHN